ncbi:3-hydroxyacyl-CoA dehydrogenase NAD-binding domain-containing protein [Devosia sp. A369]
MTPPDFASVKRIACIGGGTIGAGWAAYFLARGFDVAVMDNSAEIRDALPGNIARIWPSLEQLGLAPGSSQDRLRVVSTIAEAVRDADFIQENVPERVDLKTDTLSQIDAHAPKSTVIASSTSGILASILASACNTPGRLVVGHPFTPSYLIPLVEVSGSDQTDPAVLEWAMGFYSAIGKFPMLIRKEVTGFVVNRLQNVLLDEASRLVNDGVCSYADIDDAIVQGVGLRWAFMGLATAVHLTGGRGGYKHALHQFGWRGGDVSRKSLGDALEERLGNVPMSEIEAWRDQNIIKVMQARAAMPTNPVRPNEA